MFSLLEAIYLYLRKAFWSKEFWLPPNLDWTECSFPQATDISYAFFMALIVSLFRLCFTRFIFIPLGLKTGIKMNKIRPVQSIPYLEANYRVNKRPPYTEMMALSKKLDVSIITVSRWYHRKRNSEKFPTILKFAESAWKFTFYLFISVFGLLCLYKEPFLYDTSLYYLDYPNQKISELIFWYYMIELGNYFSLCVWVFFEVKRNDFHIMLTHHAATCSLLIFSYLTNFHRIGSVILLLHDVSDVCLEAAKICKYMSVPSISGACLVIFIITWTLTRLYWFPFKVISSIFFEAPLIIGFFPSMILFASFLLILQILHIFWTVLIIRTAAKPVITGKLVGDARSESEMSETELNESNNMVSNGCGVQHCTQNGYDRRKMSCPVTSEPIKFECNENGKVKTNWIF